MTAVYRGASESLMSNYGGSFAKEPYKRDDILQKRPVIYRGGAAIIISSLHNCAWVILIKL